MTDFNFLTAFKCYSKLIVWNYILVSISGSGLFFFVNDLRTNKLETADQLSMTLEVLLILFSLTDLS